jgi:hypothetical protein
MSAAASQPGFSLTEPLQQARGFVGVANYSGCSILQEDATARLGRVGRRGASGCANLSATLSCRRLAAIPECAALSDSRQASPSDRHAPARARLDERADAGPEQKTIPWGVPEAQPVSGRMPRAGGDWNRVLRPRRLRQDGHLGGTARPGSATGLPAQGLTRRKRTTRTCRSSVCR